MSYTNRPMQMFGGLGLVTMLAGGAAAVTTVGMKLALGMDMTGNPLLYMTIMLFLASIQFISLGFLGELTTRTYHESQSKPIYVVREIVETPEARRETVHPLGNLSPRDTATVGQDDAGS